MITKVEYKTIHIPEAYFNLSEIYTNRSIITNRDVSLFMLDLYKAYNECKINLESIKEINQKGE